MNSFFVKLYNAVLIGYIFQFIALLSGFLIDISLPEYQIFYVWILWIIGAVLNGIQYSIFCKLFNRVYGNVENFRRIQQDNGARLRKYRNIYIWGYQSFILDMQFNKTIVISHKELNYMRKWLRVSFFLPITEFIIVVIMVFFNVFVR